MSVWRGCGGTGRFLHRIKEGGSWGKHGFPHGSETEASDAHPGDANAIRQDRPMEIAVSCLDDGLVLEVV